MTSGIKLSAWEQQYIRDHVKDGPGDIAHYLSRPRKTVESFIRRERTKTEDVIELRLPSDILREAQDRGITRDHMHFVAMRAILVKIKESCSTARTYTPGLGAGPRGRTPGKAARLPVRTPRPGSV